MKRRVKIAHIIIDGNHSGMALCGYIIQGKKFSDKTPICQACVRLMIKPVLD